MRLLGKISQYEKIVAYMKDPTGDDSGLTEHDKQVLERWMEAWTLIRNYSSDATAVAFLMKRFPGLSRSTAFRDCKMCVSLFGDISYTTKTGIKNLATEITKDAIAIAKIKNNEDGMMKGAANLARINGVNTTDPDLPEFDLLEPHTYELTLPDNVISMLQMMGKSGKIDLTQVVHNMANNAQDADIIEDDED